MAVGSARAIADPFLAFMRHVLWPLGCPTIQDGTFSAVWTLVHAIDTNAGGVAEPIQVAVLERQGNDWQARELVDAELRDHRQAVLDAEGALKQWRATFAPAAPCRLRDAHLEPPRHAHPPIARFGRLSGRLRGRRRLCHRDRAETPARSPVPRRGGTDWYG